MKLRIWSDIHNEFGTLDWTRRGDDDETTLVIAGDFQVGDRSFDLMLELCNAFKYVLYTCGNHEYYKNEINATDHRFSAFEADSKNFYFLNPGTVVLDGVRFIGATLWTDLDDGNPVTVEAVRRAMNDYRQIEIGEKYSDLHDEKKITSLQPYHTMELNHIHSKFIEDTLKVPFEGKTVIFTHHAPLMLCVGNDPRYQGGMMRQMNFAYGNTKLDHLFFDYDFDYWFHGHVHMWQEHEVNGKKIIARPRGYIGFEDCAMKYDTIDADAQIIEV